jgi:hypothetical protein
MTDPTVPDRPLTAAEGSPIRFFRVTDHDRRRIFYCAVYADIWDAIVDGYAQQSKLILGPFEFTDPQIVADTADWLADATLEAAREDGRPALVLVGSTYRGRWVDWNLPAPKPPVPKDAPACASRACVCANGSGPVPSREVPGEAVSA